MKKTIIVFSILFVSFYSSAQVQLERSLVSAGGTFASSAGITLEYSIGEPVIATNTSGSIMVTQGFHQPSSLPVNITQPFGASFSLLAFPNPVSSVLSVEIILSVDSKIELQLYDVTGRVLFTQTSFVYSEKPQVINLSMESLAPAIYFLKISSQNENQIIGLNKIIKI